MGGSGGVVVPRECLCSTYAASLKRVKLAPEGMSTAALLLTAKGSLLFHSSVNLAP